MFSCDHAALIWSLFVVLVGSVLLRVWTRWLFRSFRTLAKGPDEASLDAKPKLTICLEELLFTRQRESVLQDPPLVGTNALSCRHAGPN